MRKRRQLILSLTVALIAVLTAPTVEVEKYPVQINNEVQQIPSMAIELPQLQQELAPVAVEQPPTGSHTDWMAAAGISPSDYSYVEFIISHESGWKPCAYNPGKNDCTAKPTTACGLVQALPCSKLGDNWHDPVVALKWGNKYAIERYGSWAKAHAFWVANRWW